MSSSSINTQVGLQSFTINGTDVKRHVNSMQIYESICKPYITAVATVIDRADIINNLKVVGGENVSFTVQADGAGTYSGNAQIFSIKGNRQSYNLRTMLYEIQLVGSQFFGDRQNLVQQSFNSIIGTDIISKVHSQFVGGSLNIPIPSIGLLAKGNPIVASSLRPFKFIDNIRRQLMFGQYQTGSSVYYADNKGVNLAPLEHLFTTLSPQANFIQKATWGSRWQDIFEAQNAIIEAATVEDNQKQGQLNMYNISTALNQEKKVFDAFSHKRIFNDLATNIVPGTVAGTPISSLIKLAAAVAGGHGGRHNYYFFDSEKFPRQNIRQTDKESLYQAMITSGPHIIIKVPTQGGFNCTVGKGFSAKLIPPMGDLSSVNYDPQNSGNYLAIHICHDLHFDDTTPGGTSIIQGAKGGIAQ